MRKGWRKRVFHTRTKDAAKGKWRGILRHIGLPEEALRNKHGPCPLCDSKDNFRWDDKDGTGSYICTCSAGDGMSLAMAFTGRQFPDIAAEIDALVGNLTVETPKPGLTPEFRRDLLRATFAKTKRIAEGDLADKYLTSRGVGGGAYPETLRYGVLEDGDGGLRPCMTATVADPTGKAVTLHRTFLRSCGTGKAEMASPRKIMPGEIPDGSAVRLSAPRSVLGIAEGIETAMSAELLFDVPTWAALNSAMLAKWEPPPECEEVVIFGDNDPKFAGQAAAYALAHRLAVRRGGPKVTVHIPATVKTDWNDELMLRIPTNTREATP